MLEKSKAETSVRIRRATEYRTAIDRILAHRQNVEDYPHDTQAHVRYVRVQEQKAVAYAGLLRAALDLFEDGDLFDKWHTACQDAGVGADR